MRQLTNLIIDRTRELSKAISDNFEKSVVRAHTRKTKSGKMSNVKQHTDKRQKKQWMDEDGRVSSKRKKMSDKRTGKESVVKEKTYKWDGDTYTDKDFNRIEKRIHAMMKTDRRERKSGMKQLAEIRAIRGGEDNTPVKKKTSSLSDEKLAKYFNRKGYETKNVNGGIQISNPGTKRYAQLGIGFTGNKKNPGETTVSFSPAQSGDHTVTRTYRTPRKAANAIRSTLGEVVLSGTKDIKKFHDKKYKKEQGKSNVIAKMENKLKRYNAEHKKYDKEFHQTDKKLDSSIGRLSRIEDYVERKFGDEPDRMWREFRKQNPEKYKEHANLERLIRKLDTKLGRLSNKLERYEKLVDRTEIKISNKKDGSSYVDKHEKSRGIK